jgi:hypothetical protein
LLEEKQVTLQSKLQLDRSFQEVQFENLDVTASAFQFRASGSIREPAGALITDISGTWNPNWQLLEPLMQSYVGSMVTLNQVRGGPFQVRGPVLNPGYGQPNEAWLHPQLQVATSTGFESGTLLGLPIGGSPVNLTLSGGIANIQTSPISFSGGTINLSPSVDLRGPSPVVNVPAGTVLQNVELTPDICRGWLKFVAPVIADATAASGKFSVSTQGLRLPLDQINNAEMSGTILLHGANVGPGPLGQQLIGLVKQVKTLASGSPLDAALASATGQPKTWMTMPDQQIPISLRQGRVTHEGMQFQIDDVTVRTRGTVGLDQSMQLVAEIPVLDKWIANNRWAVGLKGQTFQIPVAGTVSRPQIDSSALARVSGQMLQGAATGAINQEVQGLIQKGNQRLEDELIKGVGKWFEPKK